VHVTHRIANYRKLLGTRFADSVSAPGRVRNAEVFRRKVRGAVVHQARLELDRGRFDSAAITVQRAIDVDAADPDAWVILGEARERSNSAPDPEAAIEAYTRALTLDRSHAGAHRALGLLYYRDVKNGGAAPERGAAARVHLARYLEVAPEAPDAGHVRAYLSELGGAREAGPAPSASGGSL
jgi:tetratricopeptide (TPR) repeat protein